MSKRRRQSTFSIASNLFGPTALASDLSLDSPPSPPPTLVPSKSDTIFQHQIDPFLESTKLVINKDYENDDINGIDSNNQGVAHKDSPTIRIVGGPGINITIKPSGQAFLGTDAPLTPVPSAATQLSVQNGSGDIVREKRVVESNALSLDSGGTISTGITGTTGTTATMFTIGSRRSSLIDGIRMPPLPNFFGRRKSSVVPIILTPTHGGARVSIHDDTARSLAGDSIMFPVPPQSQEKETKAQRRARKVIEKKWKRELKKLRRELKKQNRVKRTQKILRVVDDAKEKFWEWLDRRDEKRRKKEMRQHTVLVEERRKSMATERDG